MTQETINCAWQHIYMIYVLSHANLLVQLCLLIWMNDCRTRRIYRDTFFIVYFLCIYIYKYVCHIKYINFYYDELFVTKLSLTICEDWLISSTITSTQPRLFYTPKNVECWFRGQVSWDGTTLCCLPFC